MNVGGRMWKRMRLAKRERKTKMVYRRILFYCKAKFLMINVVWKNCCIL